MNKELLCKKRIENTRFAKIAVAIISVFLFIFLTARTQTAAATQIPSMRFTLNGELKAFINISTRPVYREGSVESQVSSWDTTGGNDDGFSGKYSFVRRNKDSSLVLFDIKGAGAINRIWAGTVTIDTLDFFINDTLHPSFSIKHEDLFSGKVFPFVAPLCGTELGGYYCYFPILFHTGCRTIARAKKMQFHQIQYRQYPKGFRVQSFTMNLSKDEKKSLSSIATCWNKENRCIPNFICEGRNDLLTATANIEIKPGEKNSLFILKEGGRILGTEFYLAGPHTAFNKNIDLQIHWDDDKNPAVGCPLAGFFGYAFGVPPMKGLLLGFQKNIRYCYFPMPFDRKAAIQLMYGNSEHLLPVLAVKAKIYYTKIKRDSAREGRFYTSWKSNTLYKENGPHVFLNTSGKGHYVGTILQARAIYSGMTYFFEGDDSTATDGIFKIHGTGSEDYFNGSWYAFSDRWGTKMNLPLHGCLDYSLVFCRTGGYRFYLSDKIPFEKNIFHSIEHGPVYNKIPVSYTSLALYYGNTAPSQFTKPARDLTDVAFLDTLLAYPQLANLTIWGDIVVKSLWAYPTDGTSFLFIVNDESPLSISMETIPSGNYKVFADFAKTPEGCAFSNNEFFLNRRILTRNGGVLTEN